MELLDTTLREGEQCFGVFFPVDAKIKLACLLDRMGIDFIEVGHPAAAPSIRQAVAGIAALPLNARILAHARLDREEILLVRELSLPWVGLFAGINAISLRRYDMTRSAAFQRIKQSVLFAKDLGLRVRFTCEDASRTDQSLLADLYGSLLEFGADRLSYADTIGVDTPETIGALHGSLNRTIPFSLLHFHFHDDQGRARDNAIQATALGAQCIDASILGIGERSGLVSLEDALVLRASHTGGLSGRGRALLTEARSLVAAFIRPDHFSQRRFTHKAGTHIHGMLKDPLSFEVTGLSDAVTQRQLVLSKLIGRSGLRTMLSWAGIEVDEALESMLLERVKANEFLELADRREIVLYLIELCSQMRCNTMAGQDPVQHPCCLCPA